MTSRHPRTSTKLQTNNLPPHRSCRLVSERGANRPFATGWYKLVGASHKQHSPADGDQIHKQQKKQAIARSMGTLQVPRTDLTSSQRARSGGLPKAKAICLRMPTRPMVGNMQHDRAKRACTRGRRASRQQHVRGLWRRLGLLIFLGVGFHIPRGSGLNCWADQSQKQAAAELSKQGADEQKHYDKCSER
jgi:hypothetical protein